MNVEAVALTDFVHDRIRGERDQSLSLNESTAARLEKKGLILIKTQPNDGAIEGKALAAGMEQASSALLAAPVLPQTTSNERTGGGTLHLKSEKQSRSARRG